MKNYVLSSADGFLMTKISTRLKCEVGLSVKSLVPVDRVFICGVCVCVCVCVSINMFVCCVGNSGRGNSLCKLALVNVYKKRSRLTSKWACK